MNNGSKTIGTYQQILLGSGISLQYCVSNVYRLQFTTVVQL